MEKITLEQIDRYITLKNELAIEDPYVLKVSKDEVIKRYGTGLKRVLTIKALQLGIYSEVTWWN